ncbi:hypothetical protein N7470_001475 [Penicillium chermesinum]|nr:hypothetical protein N7470_001475 [Penicillium chermesinum]
MASEFSPSNIQGSSPSGQNSSPSNKPKESSPNGGVELKTMRPNAPPSIPIGEDIMQLARIGEIGAMQNLFNTKKLSANYRDEEGITPLHWAALNNQYAMCKFLLDSGADVNAKGGESVATPAMWATQRSLYYIVDLLLQYGADPLLTDVQGFNMFHLATVDGNAFLLLLLLQQELPVDETDPLGHTGLMWAAYKGYPVCVDLFLRWGANANAVDQAGLTPLHWALVKGSLPCVRKLLEYGADRFAKTRDGKSPFTVAQEMNSLRVWNRALDERGFESDGSQKPAPMGMAYLIKNKSLMAKFFFFWPFITVFIALWMLSNLAIYIGVPVAAATVFGMQTGAQQVANNGPMEFRNLHQTPYLAGIFAGSLFWVGVRFALQVLPVTFSVAPILSIFFSVFYSLTTFFYAMAMLEDPGYVPRTSSQNSQREEVKQLVEQWKFDEVNFCVPCLSRKPLRSKHCRQCNRCVAKHDHHCPWIFNCVGANNLRHFVLYIVCLEVGIILFVQLSIKYISAIPSAKDAKCTFLNDTLCDYVSRDTFTLVLTIWTTVHLVWVTMLCAVQLIQVSRNQTTYENLRGHSADMATPSARAFASAMTAGTTSMEGAGLSAAGQGPNPALPGAHQHHHHRRRNGRNGCLSQWSAILGIDSFFITARDGLRDGAHSRQPRNPFSRGVATNCRDFWCDPAPIFSKRDSGYAMLGGEVVSYYDMYELPARLHTGSRSSEGPTYRSVAAEDPESLN